MDFFKRSRRARTYLDFASATPRDQKMIRDFPVLRSDALLANPSALHAEGLAAKAALSEARGLVARTLEVHQDEIIFTAHATESDNMAIRGVVHHWLEDGVRAEAIAIAVSEFEHAAVSESVVSLRQRGVRVLAIAAENGVIDPASIALPEEVTHLLVTCMYVNNEIGTVMPIREVAKRIRDLRKQFPEKVTLLHTDATQAPLYFALRIPSLGVDLMTLGATKLYCTRGVGLLYKKRTVPLTPIIFGGGQEHGLRPGTPALALIHEFAHALAYAQTHRHVAAEVMTVLQHYFESQLQQTIPSAIVAARDRERSPHISHIALKGFDSELLVIELDARGIAVSAKSACKNETDNESPIVESLYGSGWGAIRVSYGRTTTKRDLDRAIHALADVVKKYT